LSGIERSNYIESNNLGRRSCPVSEIERIRYSGCFITLKKRGENSGPTKSSGFMEIQVLGGSGLEGFYCIPLFSSFKLLHAIMSIWWFFPENYFVYQTKCIYYTADIAFACGTLFSSNVVCFYNIKYNHNIDQCVRLAAWVVVGSHFTSLN